MAGKTELASADNWFLDHRLCPVPSRFLFQFPLLIQFLRPNQGPRRLYLHRRYQLLLPALRFPMPAQLARLAEESAPALEEEALALEA